jgi:hypothetical protein
MNKFFLIVILATLSVSIASASLAFQNGQVVALGSTPPSNCTSTPALLYQNFSDAVVASAVTNCEIGIGFFNTTGMSPYYMLNPAFGGLSMYGEQMWNATPSGYPIFNNITIVTDCGASGTPTRCNSTKKYFYSYTSSSWESQMGITGGVLGLPEGVLPRPAHDILLPSSIGSTPVTSYLVRVWVFDPNIFPNETTGTCEQLIPSNLSNPIENCLNNTAALARAIATTSTSVVAANKNNILFTSKNIPPSGGIPPWQAVIIYDVPTVNLGKVLPGQQTTMTMHAATNITQSNTNLEKTLFVVSVPTSTIPQATTVATTVATTMSTAIPSVQTNTSYTAPWLIITVVVVIVILAAYSLLRKKK